MKTQIFTLFALASSATATFDWLDAKKFSCPQNTDNKCIDQQKGGFKWEGLDLGKFTKFADFDFSGFTCVDSFDGLLKRDMITGRTFQNKCIKGRATEDKTSAPSFGCGTTKNVEKFSVKTFQISVEYDVDLEFHYDMPDGSLCKQKQSCKKTGTTVNNSQCGGAKTVTVVVPKGKGKGKNKGCDVGFHDIEFDCLPPKNTPPKTTTTASSPATTPVQQTTPAQETTPVPETTPAQETTPVPETTPVESEVESTSSTYSQTQDIPYTTPGSSTTSDASPVGTTSTPLVETTPVTTPGETTPIVTPPAASTVSTFTEVVTSTITSCGAEVISCPARSTVVTTSTIISSTTIPVVTTPAASTTDESPVTTTTPTTPSIPIPTSECPPVLPQCLNTWLFDSECKSNTDVNCFCKSEKFVEAIYQCLSAYGADDEEIDKAQNFFQGICAPHVPGNPAIITDATTLTVTHTPAVTSIPVTTIQLQTTITVPCIQTEGPSSGATIPGSSTTKVISTAVTVPQVVFETITGTSTNVVSLVQGTPTAPATAPVIPTTAVFIPTTPAVVVPTTLASIGVPVNGTATLTGRPPQFTSAASRNGLTIGSFLVAGVAAALML